VVEVLRFKLLELEYGLSPNGGLRAWLRLNMLVCVLLGTPLLLIVPIITWFLSSFTTWSAFLRQASLNVLYMMLAIAATVTIAIAIHYGVKQYAALNRRNKYRQQQNRRR
jgi:predicted RND superfamily exporter protein